MFCLSHQVSYQRSCHVCEAEAEAAARILITISQAQNSSGAAASPMTGPTQATSPITVGTTCFTIRRGGVGGGGVAVCGAAYSPQPFPLPSGESTRGSVTPPLLPPRDPHQQGDRPGSLLVPSGPEQAHKVLVVSNDSWDCSHCDVQYGTKTQAETCAASHNCARDGRHYFSVAGSSLCQVCRRFWQCPHPSCDKIFSSSRAAERCYSSHHGTTTLKSLRSGAEF